MKIGGSNVWRIGVGWWWRAGIGFMCFWIIAVGIFGLFVPTVVRFLCSLATAILLLLRVSAWPGQDVLRHFSPCLFGGLQAFLLCFLLTRA